MLCCCCLIRGLVVVVDVQPALNRQLGGISPFVSLAGLVLLSLLFVCVAVVRVLFLSMCCLCVVVAAVVVVCAL